MTQDEIIAEHIRATVKSCRAKGTVGISIENLRQITPTRGLTMPPAAYPDAFERIARTVAKTFVR